MKMLGQPSVLNNVQSGQSFPYDSRMTDTNVLLHKNSLMNNHVRYLSR
jgi:hypothetical protein